MTKWLNVLWLADVPFISFFASYFIHIPILQNWAHAQITEHEYRDWHPEKVTLQGISCYQCGGTEQIEQALNHKDCGIACTRCKSILWRKATTL